MTHRSNSVAIGVMATTCLAGSLLLVLGHLQAVELPGCGSLSDCSRATASRWGRVPGIDWPVSFLGFAYFQALCAALLVGHGGLTGALLAVTLVGGVGSLVLIAAMFGQGYLCGYCLIVNLSNLVLVACLCLSSRSNASAPHSWISLGAFVATFAVASVLLAFVDGRWLQEANASVRSTIEDALNASADWPTEGQPFAPGRYVLGPQEAKVHVTVVSDYQCPTCRRIDAQLRAMTAGRDDVAISARHFPFCSDCNQHVEKTQHPNACRAAVAAEAAGSVGGAVTFWKMHDWLFARNGTFADEELLLFVEELALEREAFMAAIRSKETIDLIKMDAEAADAAGLQFTPMIFINGRPIELPK